tara:strand:+ start:17518 stop:18324 length:807 start_codon:yes stop_codon:yes gene_type:complete
MSSIYRKGRDGYYYYQTYIYNPKTGKKDKRIFHSLGTKDAENAKQKQNKLDLQYGKSVFSNSRKPIVPIIFKKYKIFLIVVVSVLTTVIIMDNYQKTPLKFVEQSNSDKKMTSIVKEKSTKKNDTTSLTKNSSKEDLQNSDIEKKIDTTKTIHKTGVTADQPLDYKVVRVERGAGPFEQGKIYATAPKRTDSKTLLKICRELVSQNNEFLNFVICIYDDSITGLEISKGNEMNYSNEKVKSSWLVMFSYNPVEGEYFDDNPGGYMGAF